MGKIGAVWIALFQGPETAASALSGISDDAVKELDHIQHAQLANNASACLHVLYMPTMHHRYERTQPSAQA